MLIRFHCSCGMVLSVKAEAAAGYQTCPRCHRSLALAGQSAGAADDTGQPLLRATESSKAELIALQPFYALADPARKPTISYRVVELDESAVDCPLLPAVEQQPARIADSPKVSLKDIEDRDVRRILAKAKGQLRRYRWSRRLPLPLETNVWQCLFYPLLLLGEILCLALLMAVPTPILVLALPTPNTTGLDDWLPRVPLLLLPLVLAGITWGFLRQVLRLSVLGDIETMPKVLQEFRALAYAGLMVVSAFLAGPAILVGAAVWFWVHAGSLQWLDHVLLWQLGLGAGVGWVFLLLAVEARGRLRDVHAGAVAALVRRQGWPALVFPVLAGASVTLFFYLTLHTWISFFDEVMLAFMLQFVWWCAGLFTWTFLMRWYGMTRFWRRKARQQAEIKPGMSQLPFTRVIPPDSLIV